MTHTLELYGQWVRREISQRFAGSVLGPLWLLLQPLSFIAVITLIFYGVFRTRWPGGDGSALDYALQVFVGLSVHGWCAEVLSRSPGSITAHPYLVTKVRFPLALLPAVVHGVALAQCLLSLALVALVAAVASAAGALQATPSWAALPLLPLVLLPSVLLLAGLGWLLAALGPYWRDLGNLMPAVSSLLMFLMPVFYPASMVPEGLTFLLTYNPLAYTIEGLRGLLLSGTPPDVWAGAAHLAAAAAVAGIGAWFFRRVRSGFADVL
jgi:lipopolysaccharide transport system permease protein